MNEHLLQYIWQHRLYDSRQLMTEDQQPLIIIHQGQINQHQGSDFLHAQIRLNQLEFFGSVEIHIKTSDWERHRHSGDPHYNNVILHVVWDHDIDFHLPVPVLCLKGRIAQTLLQRYRQLISKTELIPCAPHLRNISDLVMLQWKERLMIERLNQKSVYIQNLIDSTRQNEEAVFWCLIFRNMGMPVNADAFESIFMSIPFNILLRAGQRIQVAEALLLGQAKFLNDLFEDEYLIMLQKEYRYLAKKHNLTAPPILLSNLRMRPAHFPALRLAQLAMLLHTHHGLYAMIMEAESLAKMRSLLMVTANDFWHYHYSLKNNSPLREKQVGSVMADMILVNTVLPFRYWHALKNKHQKELSAVMDFFVALRPEQNKILNNWRKSGLKIENAADAQALLHLTKNYCKQKECLKCNIGNAIINKQVNEQVKLPS